MLILGIGGCLHDGAAALMRNGEIVAAMEEEKLIRQRHPGGLPDDAIDMCLRIGAARRRDVELVALSTPLGTNQDTSFHLQLRTLFPESRMVVVDHHTSHAAAAFFPSPFKEARVLTLDRYGDIRCGATWNGVGSRLEMDGEIYPPDSPAALYSRTTELLGFKSDAEEHKVQWLSVSGRPRFRRLFKTVLGLGSDGLAKINHSYFDTARTTEGGFGELFYKRLKRKPGEQLDESQRNDIAATIQTAVEEVVLRIAGEGRNLCFGGGLAYNALLVRALENSGNYESVWAQPVAGNAGNAVGSALYAWHVALQNRKRFVLRDLFLGPEYDSQNIKQVLDNCKVRFRHVPTDHELLETALTHRSAGNRN
ncbi:MAG: carbamoyltransferase N-terminal domain-containing protein, partial [bacterium]